MGGAHKSAAPLSVPRRVKTICFIHSSKCCFNMLSGEASAGQKHPVLAMCWRYVGAIFRSWALAERILRSCRVRSRFWSVFLHLGALHGRFWRGQGRFGEGFGGSNGLFFNVFSSFRVHARWRCAKAPDVQKPQFFQCFS